MNKILAVAADAIFAFMDKRERERLLKLLNAEPEKSVVELRERLQEMQDKP